MSHVDEGQLHAYLDGALGSDELRSRVEDHLRLCADCRSRLDAARRDREEAGQILALLDPGEVRVPPMEELRGEGQGAAQGLTRGERATGAGARRPGPAVPLRLAWAASVLLALGGGWMLRSAALPGEDGVASRVASAVSVAETRGGAAADHAAGRAEDVAPDLAADGAAEGAVALAAPAPSAPVPGGASLAEAPAVAGREPAQEPVQEPVVDAVAVAGDLAMQERTEGSAAWVDISPAGAAELLGRPPLELEGIPWERLEVLQAEDQILVRSFHPLENGARIELLQGRHQGEAASVEAGAIVTGSVQTGSVQTRSAATRAPQASRLAQERMRAGMPVDAGVLPFPPAGDEPDGHTVVRSEREGISFLLRGPVDAAVLAELIQRVR